MSLKLFLYNVQAISTMSYLCSQHSCSFKYCSENKTKTCLWFSRARAMCLNILSLVSCYLDCNLFAAKIISYMWLVVYKFFRMAKANETTILVWTTFLCLASTYFQDSSTDSGMSVKEHSLAQLYSWNPIGFWKLHRDICSFILSYVQFISQSSFHVSYWQLDQVIFVSLICILHVYHTNMGFGWLILLPLCY